MPINVNGEMELFANGKIEAWSSGCYRPYGTVRGAWVQSETEISFVEQAVEGNFLLELTTVKKVAR